MSSIEECESSVNNGSMSAGQYGTTTDDSLTMFDRGRSSYRGVVLALPGRTLHAVTWGPIATSYEHVRALVRAGYVVVAIDAGGIITWPCPSTMTAIDNAVPIALTRFGGTKVGLLGFSLGVDKSLNWMKRHPTLVAGHFGFSGSPDLSWAYGPAGYAPDYGIAAASATYQAEINTSFGCTTATYTTATAGYRMYDEPASWRGGPPVRLVHADDDGTVPVRLVKEFVANVNDPNVTLRELATGGHGPWAGIDPSETVGFFNSLAW